MREQTSSGCKPLTVNGPTTFERLKVGARIEISAIPKHFTQKTCATSFIELKV